MFSGAASLDASFGGIPSNRKSSVDHIVRTIQMTLVDYPLAYLEVLPFLAGVIRYSGDTQFQTSGDPLLVGQILKLHKWVKSCGHTGHIYSRTPTTVFVIMERHRNVAGVVYDREQYKVTHGVHGKRQCTYALDYMDGFFPTTGNPISSTPNEKLVTSSFLSPSDLWSEPNAKS